MTWGTVELGTPWTQQVKGEAATCRMRAMAVSPSLPPTEAPKRNQRLGESCFSRTESGNIHENLAGTGQRANRFAGTDERTVLPKEQGWQTHSTWAKSSRCRIV